MGHRDGNRRRRRYVFQFDADAQAFFDAAGITDITQKNAINALVTDLKGFSLWGISKCIYPIVGGTASTHSFNLKDPSLYQTVWVNTPTQDANGVTYNGTSSYGQTGFIPSANQTDDNLSYGCSVSSDTQSNGRDLGAFATDGDRLGFTSRSTVDGVTMYNTHLDSNVTAASASSIGVFISSRRGNEDHEGYKDGASFDTDVNADSGAPPDIEVYIGARNNNGTAQTFTDHRHNFYFFADGLTDAEAANYTTAIQDYNIAMGR